MPTGVTWASPGEATREHIPLLLQTPGQKQNSIGILQSEKCCWWWWWMWW